MITYLTKLPWRAFRGGIVITVLGTFYAVRSVPKWPRKLTSAARAVEPWGILIAVVALVMTAIDFEEDRTARAWQLLASDAPGNSGKIWALEYLGRARHCLDWIPGFGLLPENWQDAVSVRECPPREPLTGIDLSPRDGDVGTYLWGVRLERAFLTHADFAGASLGQSNLAHAELSGANLSGANLQLANLSGSSLLAANLSGADLGFANLSGTQVAGADISSAVLIGANLSRAWGTFSGEPNLGISSPPVQCQGNPAQVALRSGQPLQIWTVECDDALNPRIGRDGYFIVVPDEPAD